jgi:hypothetical protein
MLFAKLLIYTVLVIIVAFIIYEVATYVSNVIDAVYSRQLLVDAMDQIIKLFKYQQVLLADIDIPVRFTLSRATFTDNVLEVYRHMNAAYTNDIDKVIDRFPEEHGKSTKLSYEDNINSINIFLSEYNALNVRYSVDKDNLPFVNRLFPEYKFLDQDLKYMSDNGIENTGAGL